MNSTTEDKVENSLVRFIRTVLKGLCYKFTPQGVRGAPDRLILLPIPTEHQEIVAQYVYFVEAKRPKGGTLRPWQKREIAKIREKGFRVYLVNWVIPKKALSILDGSPDDIKLKMCGHKNTRISSGETWCMDCGICVES